MWSLVRPLLEGALVVSLQDVAAAIRFLVERNRVVAEGAGGASVAAARAGKAGNGRVGCVVSRGNIDTAGLGQIPRGEGARRARGPSQHPTSPTLCPPIPHPESPP